MRATEPRAKQRAALTAKIAFVTLCKESTKLRKSVQSPVLEHSSRRGSTTGQNGAQLSRMPPMELVISAALWLIPKTPIPDLLAAAVKAAPAGAPRNGCGL